jgi:hypothetical protein
MHRVSSKRGLSPSASGVALRLGCVATLLPRALLAEPAVATLAEPAVYGADTRQEARLHPDPLLRDRARLSTLALVPKASLTPAGERMQFSAPSFAEENPLCEDAAFQDQPVLADCSGVLVAADLVLTAGHCVESQAECERTAFVLDFTLNEGGELVIPSDKVFECEELLAQELTPLGKPVLFDHALIRLKAPGASGGRPVPVRGDPVGLTEPLALIGTSLGLPIKIDSAGKVVDPGGADHDYFAAQFDLFHRGSGSPVFDMSGNLVGVGVRGGVDFDSEGACVRLRSVSENSTYAEEASYASTALIRSGGADGVEWSLARADDREQASAGPGASCSARPGPASGGAWLSLCWFVGSVWRARRRRPSARFFSRLGCTGTECP